MALLPLLALMFLLALLLALLPLLALMFLLALPTRGDNTSVEFATR